MGAFSDYSEIVDFGLLSGLNSLKWVSLENLASQAGKNKFYESNVTKRENLSKL